MFATLLKRSIPFFAAVAVIVAPAGAHAVDATIDINPGNVPTTAAGFGDHSCDQVPGDVGENEDGWVFVLPSDHGAMGEFVVVNATFEDLNGDTRHYSTDANGGIVDGPGTSKAYIITPAGWTLVTATADVTDVDSAKAMFNLTHTCPGEVPPNGETPTSTPSEAPSEPSSTPPSTETTTDSEAPALPTTGGSLAIVLSAGAVLLGAGGSVLYLMRRRRLAETGH
ncbi:hypothetical protein GCM10027447_28140 [Glycomyces halotolerans]